MSEHLDFETEHALRDVARTYFDIIEVPQWAQGVGQFAKVHANKHFSKPSTLITMTDPFGLALSFEGSAITGAEEFLVNIDFSPDEPAAIVRPGFYDSNGDPDAERGKFDRPILRFLTDQEGLALILDLRSVTANPPQAL